MKNDSVRISDIGKKEEQVMKITDIKTKWQNRKPLTKRDKTIISFACVMALVLGVVLWITNYVNSKMNLIDYASLDEEWVVATDADLLSDSDEFEAIDENTVIELPEDELFKDKNVINILLLGTDERKNSFSNSARSDAMMIVSINKNTDKIKLVSLERGMAVKMPNGKVDILTHAFHYGGPKWIISCVQTHFNVDVEKYIRVNFNIFKKLIDSIGGVDITLTEKESLALNHKIRTNTGRLPKPVHEGKNHMDGYTALQYCRLRYTDSDWVRIKRQRNTIKAIQKQCKTLSLGELDDVADAVLPMIQTNLSKGEILSLLSNAPALLNSEIEDMTIPAKGTYKSLGSINFKENSKILHEFFYGDEEQ